MLNNMDNEHIMFQQLVLLPSLDPSLLQSDMDDMGKGLQSMVNCVKNPSVWRFPAVYVYDCIWINKHISTASFFDKEHQYIRCGVYSWFYSSISTTGGMANHFPTGMSTSEVLRVEDHPRFYRNFNFLFDTYQLILISSLVAPCYIPTQIPNSSWISPT